MEAASDEIASTSNTSLLDTSCPPPHFTPRALLRPYTDEQWRTLTTDARYYRSTQETSTAALVLTISIVDERCTTPLAGALTPLPLSVAQSASRLVPLLHFFLPHYPLRSTDVHLHRQLHLSGCAAQPRGGHRSDHWPCRAPPLLPHHRGGPRHSALLLVVLHPTLHPRLRRPVPHRGGGLVALLDLALFHPLLPSSSLTPSPSTWQDFTGKLKQTLYLYPSSSSTVPRLLLVGLGKAKELNATVLRSAVYAMVTSLKHKKVKQAAVALPTGLTAALSPSVLLDVFTRISILSNHSFTRYITKKEGDRHHSLELLHFLQPSASSSSSLTPVIERAQAIAESQLMARELINDRGDVITPSVLEDFAVRLARTQQLPVRVVKGEQLKEEGLTLISAVGQGSKEGEKARIVVIEYTGDEERKMERLAVVGKAITFDSGGLNLKSTGGIEEMYMDKGGGCCVLGMVRSLALLKPKINVVAAIAIAENSIDAHSIKVYQHCTATLSPSTHILGDSPNLFSSLSSLRMCSRTLSYRR